MRYPGWCKIASPPVMGCSEIPPPVIGLTADLKLSGLLQFSICFCKISTNCFSSNVVPFKFFSNMQYLLIFHRLIWKKLHTIKTIYQPPIIITLNLFLLSKIFILLFNNYKKTALPLRLFIISKRNKLRTQCICKWDNA